MLIQWTFACLSLCIWKARSGTVSVSMHFFKARSINVGLAPRYLQNCLLQGETTQPFGPEGEVGNILFYFMSYEPLLWNTYMARRNPDGIFSYRIQSGQTCSVGHLMPKEYRNYSHLRICVWVRLFHLRRNVLMFYGCVMFSNHWRFLLNRKSRYK